LRRSTGIDGGKSALRKRKKGENDHLSSIKSKRMKNSKERSARLFPCYGNAGLEISGDRLGGKSTASAIKLRIVIEITSGLEKKKYPTKVLPSDSALGGG